MRADDPCEAPYVKTVSAQETGKKKTACCYEMPQHCIAPWVGRVYEPVQPVMRNDEDWEAMALGEWASVASFARASPGGERGRHSARLGLGQRSQTSAPGMIHAPSTIIAGQ